MIILNVLENLFRILLPTSLTISVIDRGKRCFQILRRGMLKEM